MDPQIVRMLERQLEDPIADVIIHCLGLKKVPLLPSRHTIEMMANAAVAVFEAVVEEGEGRK
jgi:branched-subunit amino acid transport protein AzlD